MALVSTVLPREVNLSSNLDLLMAFPNSFKEALVEPEASSPQTATQRDVEVSRLREEVDKMKAAYYDLREKLATLKETDITKVKEELHEFSLKLKVWAIIGSAIVALAAGLGVKQYRDLNDLLSKTFPKKLDESFQYQDRLGRALALGNNKDWRSELVILEELNEKKPEDEVVFVRLSDAHIKLDQYEEAYAVVANARDQNQFSRFQQLYSFNNAGWILLIKGLGEGKLLEEAGAMLKRAEKLGRSRSDPGLETVYGNLFIYNLITNDLKSAQKNLRDLALLDNGIARFRRDMKNDARSEWMRRVRQRRPSFDRDVEEQLKAISAD